MALKIANISVVQAPSLYGRVNTLHGNTSWVKACPHGTKWQNGVTFRVSVSGTCMEFRRQTQVFYRAYTRDKWSPSMRDAQLVGELGSAEIEFPASGWAHPVKEYSTYGELTLYFPEKLAGAKVAVCFGITEAEANATLTPGVDKELQKRVVYLEVESSVDNAPLVHDVHWSAEEKVVFGEETAEREEICPNEDAFLHIHTRGLFGKKVAVELYGRSASRERGGNSSSDRPSLGQIFRAIANANPNYMVVVGGILLIKRRKDSKADTGSSTATGDAILLKRRDYTVKENILSIAFPVDEAIRIFYPDGLDDTDGLYLEARVRIIEGDNTEAVPVVSNQLTVVGDIAENPSKVATGTMKYVIGEPENRPPGVEQPPQDPLPVELDVHVGTLTFLSGDGTESATSIKASVAGTSMNDAGSRYFTYPMTTYALRLQDFIDAGFVEREQVVTVTTNKEGNQTEELNAANIYSVEYASGGNTTTIHGFTESFRTTVQQQISTSAAIGGSDATTGLDYAKVRKLLEIVRAKGRAPIDARNVCRSGWQLTSIKEGSIVYHYRHKPYPYRYSTNQECPPGAFYLIPPKGGSFLVYVGDRHNVDVIRSWTTTTRVHNPNEREIIQKPDDKCEVLLTDRTKIDRRYIALHRGRCTASVGCITLDIGWDKLKGSESANQKVERALFNVLFSGAEGEFQNMATYNTAAGRPKKGSAALKLHLLMVEERDADHRADVDPVKNYHPMNRYKGD